MNKWWSKEEYETLEQLWVHEGLSMRQIGRQLGRSRNSTASRIRDRHLTALGARLPGQNFIEDRIAAQIALPTG